MTIIEQSLTPKSPARKSEDGIVVTPDFIAVIDGSTSKSAHCYSRDRSNGRLAMELVAATVRRLPKTAMMAQFCRAATRAVGSRYRSWGQRMAERLHLPGQGAGVPAIAAPDRMAASAVVFSRLRREIWMVGDCLCMVGGELFENPKPYEDVLAGIRAAEVQRLLAESVTVAELRRKDVARDVIIPRMLEAMKQQNVSYAVIDGFPIPLAKVRVIPLDFQPWEIVFATDGYPFLHPTLAASEAALQQQLSTDPLNIGAFKATKGWMEGNVSFDDRAYIRFTV